MEILDIGKNSLYILLNSRKLRAVRVGKVWKVPKEAIEEYFEVNDRWQMTDVYPIIF